MYEVSLNWSRCLLFEKQNFGFLSHFLDKIPAIPYDTFEKLNKLLSIDHFKVHPYVNVNICSLKAKDKANIFDSTHS